MLQWLVVVSVSVQGGLKVLKMVIYVDRFLNGFFVIREKMREIFFVAAVAVFAIFSRYL